MNLLIVESPAKAKTISKYLGPSYKVVSSHGHVRSLPSEEGAVDPNHDFAMRYEIIPKAVKQLVAIVAEAKHSDHIYLATDPDREGEAISWHILEILKQKKAIKSSTKVHRAVFHEITKKAILEALKNPRDLNDDLVSAQKTRQGLDYLVGFTLSPVLWRKLPSSRSAGRVQSVALRMICEREAEIESFKSQEYWSIHGHFFTEKGEKFDSTLIEFQGRKLEKFTIVNEAQAADIIAEIKDSNFSVKSIEKKKVNRNPQAPFSTSTMIQEASRKLGFPAKKTAKIAQKLYESININGELTGLITYMRTDSISISAEAAKAISDLITKAYGSNYLPPSPRVYKTKTKNAQEAHEAIRPTDVFKKPESIKNFLEEDQFKLYELIWNRLVASQMASAILDVMSVDIADNQGNILRATGSSIAFLGFYKVYREDIDDADEEKDKILPILKEKELLELSEAVKEQHFTQPPPRYTEASLVKRMEELGIGRPSTYPTIISILQDRKYVVFEKKRFTPELRGRLVNTFLTLFFNQYVEYDFTANLESQLDEIAAGKVIWKKVMKDFWHPFKNKTDEILSIKTSEILIKMEEQLLNYLFHKEILQNGKSIDEVIKCGKCTNGKLHLKNGRFGSFLACSNYPSCNYTKAIGSNNDNLPDIDNNQSNSYLPKILGNNPNTKEEISIRKGPYGLYVQQREGKKVKRAGLPKDLNYQNVDLNYAIGLLNMPREIGTDQEGVLIKAGIGKLGPYLERGGEYISLRTAKIDPVLITIEEALEIIKKTSSNNKGEDTKEKKSLKTSL
ncbi:MAG: type I DNA topoisomerase [Candidatus Midichloria sp.]|nr:MAG: type I DNA topoisomerase [Candidatus Midichloria sp.]